MPIEDPHRNCLWTDRQSTFPFESWWRACQSGQWSMASGNSWARHWEVREPLQASQRQSNINSRSGPDHLSILEFSEWIDLLLAGPRRCQDGTHSISQKPSKLPPLPLGWDHWKAQANGAKPAQWLPGTSACRVLLWLSPGRWGQHTSTSNYYLPGYWLRQTWLRGPWYRSLSKAREPADNSLLLCRDPFPLCQRPPHHHWEWVILTRPVRLSRFYTCRCSPSKRPASAFVRSHPR